MTDRYTIVDPYADAPDGSDRDTYFNQCWEEYFNLGGEEATFTLEIASWRKRGESDGPYLVLPNDGTNKSPFIQVETIIDLMDLFARWAPAVQASAIIGVVNDLNEMDLSEVGVIERVAARAAYGVQNVLPKVLGEAKQRRQQQGSGQ